jgi:hypothetical protein
MVPHWLGEWRCAWCLLASLLLWVGAPVSAAEPIIHATPSHGRQASAPDDKARAGIPIWRTITLGAQTGVDAYRDALDAAGIKVGVAAGRHLQRRAHDPCAGELRQRSRAHRQRRTIPRDGASQPPLRVCASRQGSSGGKARWRTCHSLTSARVIPWLAPRRWSCPASPVFLLLFTASARFVGARVKKSLTPRYRIFEEFGIHQNCVKAWANRRGLFSSPHA